jgi:uncharacterized protein YcfJ
LRAWIGRLELLFFTDTIPRYPHHSLASMGGACSTYINNKIQRSSYHNNIDTQVRERRRMKDVHTHGKAKARYDVAFGILKVRELERHAGVKLSSATIILEESKPLTA